MLGGQLNNQQLPVYVINQQAKREHGRRAQIANIEAGKTVAEIVRSTLGPRAMLKMIIDMMGQVTLTNDGNAILREIDVQHPAAKTMLELARVQDEQVGDGTTSVIVLAGEFLQAAQPFIHNNYHPNTINRAFMMGMDDALEVIEKNLCEKIDVNDYDKVFEIVKTSIGTKFTFASTDFLCKLAVDAVRRVAVIDEETGYQEIDIKRLVRIEKIPGGELSESVVLDGVVVNKDVLHPKMKRRIENPRIVVLNCGLEYKKGESKIGIRIEGETDFERLMRIEEEVVENMVQKIMGVKPDLVITEKGCSDYAQHLLMRRGVSVLRRLRSTDSTRIAKATGARTVHRVEDLKEEDVGTSCGLYEVRKIGDEYFSYMVQCKDPKACSLMLRGGSKDVLNEIERNLHDAMGVVRNLYTDPRIVPGGGAVEMSLSTQLMEKSASIKGVEQLPYQAMAVAFEVIPRTLADNAGAKTIRVITELRAKHAKGKNWTWGLDGRKGKMEDMRKLKIFEPFLVKAQAIKTAIEAVCMILRIDDVVSGIQKQQQ